MSRGKTLSEDLRRIIVEKREDGESYKQIGNALHISKSTIQYVVKHFKETGRVAPLKSKGRPRKLTQRDLRRLHRHFRKNRQITAADLVVWAKENLTKTVSKSTMQRYVHRLHYGFYKAKKKPFLTALNKRNRLRWAREFQKWKTSNWDKVLWSDESTFRVVYGNVGGTIIRMKTEANNPECFSRGVQKASSLSVWGCMSASGVGRLHVYEGTIKASDYIRILETNLRPSRQKLFGNRPFRFQQDNAKPHTAKITQAWFRTNHINPLPWPARSPDLSPIENLWRYLKRKLNKRRPRTVDSLRQYLFEEWERIPVEKVKSLVESMPKRLNEVIKKKGDATKY